MSWIWRDRTSNHRLLKEVVIVHKLEIKCVRQDEICILMSCKKTASICSPYTYTPWWGPHMLSHYKILGAWAVWALTWCHQRAMNKHGRQNKDDLVCEILKKFFFFFSWVSNVSLSHTISPTVLFLDDVISRGPLVEL